MNELSSIAPNLRLGAHGLWFCEKTEPISYPEKGNVECFAVEDNSFWFQHRNSCIASVVRAFPPQGAIFDVGGGNGVVAAALQKAGFLVILVEPGLQGAINARSRGVEHVVCSTVEQIEFKTRTLPAIGLFDVLEHIEDDVSFLAQLKALLQEGGYLYLTVPAYGFLWSQEDVYAQHFRRYTLSSLCRKLQSVGFEIAFKSYIFGFLPLPIWVFRTLPRFFSKKSGEAHLDENEHALPRGFAGKIIQKLLRQEKRVIQGKRSLRFGGSCLVAARVPLVSEKQKRRN